MGGKRITVKDLWQDAEERKEGLTPQRLASLAAFAFIISQVPCFMVEPKSGSGPSVDVAPLEVAVGYTIQWNPRLGGLLRPTMIAGAWMRGLVFPYVACVIGYGKGPCEILSLINGTRIVAKVNEPCPAFPALEGYNHINEIYYGCCVLSFAGIFSAFVTVKMGIVGFMLLMYGLMMAGLTPTPALLFVAFFFTFAAFLDDSVAYAARRKRKAALLAAKQAKKVQ